jgi:hypothetical protein
MRAWLVGDYREEPRFPLRQSCHGYRRRPAEIEKYAAQLKAKMELRGDPRPPRKTAVQPLLRPGWSSKHEISGGKVLSG